MIESPLLDEVVAEKFQMVLAKERREEARETAQEAMLTVLESRFGDVPQSLVEAIECVEGREQLKSLMRTAAVCPDLAAFQDAIERC